VNLSTRLEQQSRLLQGALFLVGRQVVEDKARDNAIETAGFEGWRIGHALAELDFQARSRRLADCDLQNLRVAVQANDLRQRLRLLEHEGQGSCPAAEIEHAVTRFDAGLLDESTLKAFLFEDGVQDRIVEPGQ
jgi:hypothetical protein